MGLLMMMGCCVCDDELLRMRIGDGVLLFCLLVGLYIIRGLLSMLFGTLVTMS